MFTAKLGAKMIYDNLKFAIRAKKEDYMLFNGVDNHFLKELVDFMLKEDSVIVSLAFIESSISKIGIDYLLQNYGHKLKKLNLACLSLSDKDISIELLKKATALQRIELGGNDFTPSFVESLNELGFQYLGTEDQNYRATKILPNPTSLTFSQTVSTSQPDEAAFEAIPATTKQEKTLNDPLRRMRN